MPWIADNANGGFTDAHPWLPVAVEHLRCAVAEQERDANSTLAFYRAMLAFRRAHPTLVKGEMEILAADRDTITFLRRHDGATLFCAFNLSGKAQPLEFPPGNWKIDRGAPFETVTTGRGEQLPPYQACFALRQDEGSETPGEGA
jgi:alpha-glucosidase